MTPASLGGSNDPDNFVLLCEGCHKESPDVSKEAMLNWLEREHSVFHGDRWKRKAMRDAGIFRIEAKDAEKIVDAIKSDSEIIDAIKKRVSTHFGVGLSFGTMVWIVEEMKRICGVDAGDRDVISSHHAKRSPTTHSQIDDACEATGARRA